MTISLALLDSMPAWAWFAFFAFIVAMLALDLGVLQRKPHVVSLKEALVWCGVWFALAMGFNGLLFHWRGSEAAQEFLAAYLIELCLSVDNVFVFILVFAFFRVPASLQHRVLFWGIIGAVVMRAVFILVGVGVIERFHWVLYIFGVFLVYTGVRMALPKKDDEIHPDQNIAVRLFRRFFPVSTQRDAGTFFVVEDGRRLATPLFIVLLVIETTDLVFALDSIPAVLAITKDGFIALTSNIFAILGLRSLYFALSGVMQVFRFLKLGLAVILVFIGIKMLISHWIDLTTTLSLGVIGGVLAMSVVASLVIREPRPAKK
ncbi:MAG: Integral rane protein TerC [Verrucomicrobia bacterium]|nr:Integral rane protein TerC [Verrucomicrobiota bacterium]